MTKQQKRRRDINWEIAQLKNEISQMNFRVSCNQADIKELLDELNEINKLEMRGENE